MHEITNRLIGIVLAGEALLKAKKNEPLTKEDIQILTPAELLTEDSGWFNLLDWAIMFHNFDNINLLIKHINPSDCKKNCFTRLFSGVIGTPDRENITKITNLLLQDNRCMIPDDLNDSSRLVPYYKGAKIAINNARLLRNDASQQKENSRSFSQ